MKRIFLGDLRVKLLSTAELILKHWGYRVLASPSAAQLGRFLADVPPDLMILGQGLLAGADPELRERLKKMVAKGAPPLVVLEDPEAPAVPDFPQESLPVPLDIFSLFELTQRHLESTPRRNLRLRVQLPGMFYTGPNPSLAEVLSLSVHGLFIKTGHRIHDLNRFKVIIPLLGMKTEVEIEGEVIYRVHPGPDNNYMQGVGIEFVDLEHETLLVIKDFIENRVLGEMADSRNGSRDLDLSQLHMHGRDLTLLITSAPHKPA